MIAAPSVASPPTSAVNDGEVVQSLAERVLGRVAADDIIVPLTGEVLVARGELIDERRADLIHQAGVTTSRIRSPLTCDAEEGVCAMCYGRDLGPRYFGEPRRSGRHHRRAVDWRTRHPADDADLPHRRHCAGWPAVVPGSQPRGQDRVPQRQPAVQRQWRADRYRPQHVDCHHGRGRRRNAPCTS